MLSVGITEYSCYLENNSWRVICRMLSFQMMPEIKNKTFLIYVRHCLISQFHLRVILKSRRFLFAYLMVFNATFNNISAISWRSVYLWKKLEDLEKSSDMSQVTNKFYHNVVHLALFEIRTHNISGDSH